MKFLNLGEQTLGEQTLGERRYGNEDGVEEAIEQHMEDPLLVNEEWLEEVIIEQEEEFVPQ